MGVKRLSYSQALEDALKTNSLAEAHRIAVEKSSVVRKPKMRIIADSEKAWKAYKKKTKGMTQMSKQQFMDMWYPDKTTSGLRNAGVDKKTIQRMRGS